MGGLEAGGDGWLFSAMFVQCIAGAADGGGGSNRAATDENRYREAVIRIVKFKRLYERAGWLQQHFFLCA